MRRRWHRELRIRYRRVLVNLADSPAGALRDLAQLALLVKGSFREGLCVQQARTAKRKAASTATLLALTHPAHAKPRPTTQRPDPGKDHRDSETQHARSHAPHAATHALKRD
jgi:hypothetical protein